jgi:hypothetical protein
MLEELESAENKRDIIVQQPVAQIEESVFLASIVAKVGWSHHIVLLDKA